MQYSDYQNQAASEKITLAVVQVSSRLMGWALHSGSVYKLQNVRFSVIESVSDSGNEYAVGSSSALSAGQYFFDRASQTLFIRTTGSDNPNGRFIVARANLHFANVSVTLPHDLADGYEVFWEPMVKETSNFGVEIDTINQTSEAIEGSGTLTLYNDQDFWPANFDKLTFDNGLCRIYSYNRDLEPSDARLIFKGKINKKTYSPGAITLALQDIISELKTPLTLGTIADLEARTGSDLAEARQRLIIGRVFGHVPVNIDQVLDGYPLPGTVSAVYNSEVLTGVGTSFLRDLSPDDRLILDGEEYTVATISSDTSLTLTEKYAVPAGVTNASVNMLPDLPKRWMNRVWHIAGHPLREPRTTVAAGSSISVLFLDDASDIYAGDSIYVGTLGSGDLVKVDKVVGENIVYLLNSLATIPPIGTPVFRPAVQNVRINDTLLTYYQDYTVDAEAATLTLRNTAEANSSPIRHLTTALTFTAGSRTVTGIGLKTSVEPNLMVGVINNDVFFEILSVDSDTQLTLRTPATFNATATGRYKYLIFDPSQDKLSLDVLGKTENGETDGVLLKTAPSIVKSLLKEIGLAEDIEETSFDEAESIAYMHLGFVIPSAYNDKTTPIYRDIINTVNKSVFGSLIQNDDLKIEFNILQPVKNVNAVRFDESDILSMSFDASAANLVKTVTVRYQPREYDYISGAASNRTESKTSDTSTYLIGATQEKTFETKLVAEADARIIANRWSFILESGAGRGTLVTKLQGMLLNVGDTIEISNRKFFERVGSSSKSRLFLVEAVRRSGSQVQFEVVDLSNAFSRVAAINDFSNVYASANERERLYGGYYTDEFGLIGNDPDTSGANLIW